LNDTDERAAAAAGPDDYESPTVLWEEWLDVNATLALACAKADPLTDPQCSQGVAAS
jgi:hypothetical protein